ncbi:MAG TPA: DUF5677 domain-containing protein [Candidatus Hydrogenedentes bacterium]|nr:DUF5677 domain-containing protein [Candidatus Hydrogenedentota bacterium]
MPKFDPDSYSTVDSYTEAVEAFHAVTGMLLFEFARDERELRDKIICNFIARTNMMVRSIFRLWDLQDYQDCWIIFRSLLDRFFHLRHLQERNEFEPFEAWSFLKQCNALDRVRNDPDIGAMQNSPLFSLTEDQKQRAKSLAQQPPVWTRPKAEDIAKQSNMRFLYRFGYDYASTHVHPMADDGLQDFFSITKLEPAPDFPDQRSVLSNTLLVGIMIVQDGLNASTYSWRAVVYNFLDDMLHFLDTGSNQYQQQVLKLAAFIQAREHLCVRKSTDGTTDGSVSLPQ